MATLTVEGKQFDMDVLSDKAKGLANSVVFCDNKISQLEAELAMVKMARNGYVAQLVAELPVSEPAKKTTTRKRTSNAKSTTTKRTTAAKSTTAKRTTTASTDTKTPAKTTRKRAPAKSKVAPAAE